MALEALRGVKTAQEIAAKHKVHPTEVTTSTRHSVDGLTGVFSDKVMISTVMLNEPDFRFGRRSSST